MDMTKADRVRWWLTKASRHLDAARALASAEVAIPDVAAFHCHQAAERALKGLLVSFDEVPPDTEDLRVLLHRAGQIEGGFLSWRDCAENLNPLSTAYRHPSILDQPEGGEVEEAIEDAETIVRQVFAFVPDDLHPRSNIDPPEEQIWPRS